MTLEGTRRANLRLESVLAELVTLLRSHGIEGILLKGQGLARDYPVPHHRMCGDIDFYTGSDYERNGKLIRFALSRGFAADDIRQCIDLPDENESLD